MVKMGTVWDRTAEFLSDNIGRILPIALIAFFVPASIQGNFEAATTGASAGLVLALRLVQLAFAVLSLWGSLTLTAMALDIVSERSAGSIALGRLGPAIVVSLVMICAVLLATLPIAGIVAAGGYDMMAIARGEKFDMSGGVAGFIALYGLALAIVLLWLAARFVVTTPVLVRENRMLGALGQSWKLTRGMALRIVGVVILFVLVSWVAQLAANTVFGSVFALVAGGDGDGVNLAGVLTSIVVGAVRAGFMVIPPVFTAKLYLALTAQAGLARTEAIA